MDNENIKEILENVKKCCDIMEDNNFVVYQKQEILKLLDYITNLQEEYNNSQITLAEEWKKRLEIEEKNKHLDNQITMLKQQNNAITEMGLDYKSRNEKANWWLKEMLKQTKSDETKAIINGTLELLLNGGDKE